MNDEIKLPVPVVEDAVKGWHGLSSEERIHAVGYRRYVGGDSSELWFGIGRLQYHFLVASGLSPSDVLLDVACGALRLGQFVIPYLEPGNYQGLDAEETLIAAGIENEVKFDLIEKKRPNFIINSSFDLTSAKKCDYAISVSLLTHLNLDDIRLCAKGVREKINIGGCFYFTFFEGDSSGNLDEPSHANKNWSYSFEELDLVFSDCGWSLTYIGDWGHPRGQKMIAAHPV